MKGVCITEKFATLPGRIEIAIPKSYFKNADKALEFGEERLDRIKSFSLSIVRYDHPGCYLFIGQFAKPWNPKSVQEFSKSIDRQYEKGGAQ